MTARSKTQALGRVLLVLSLGAPTLAIAAPAADIDLAAEFRALAAPSSAVQLIRAVARHDYARQRPSVPSPFTRIPLDGTASNPGHLIAAAERRLPHSIWTAEPRTGRSPPAIS